MENSEEKSIEKNISNEDILDDMPKTSTVSKETLEEKIIGETYKAIEYDENCKMIAVEYGKINTVKAKIRTAFKWIQTFFSKLLQNSRSDKQNIKKEQIKIKTGNKTYDPNAETIRVPKEVINNRLRDINNRGFEEQIAKHINANSGPIFYNFKEEIENMTIKKENGNSNIKNEDRKYKDLPNIDGKNRNELER